MLPEMYYSKPGQTESQSRIESYQRKIEYHQHQIRELNRQIDEERRNECRR